MREHLKQQQQHGVQAIKCIHIIIDDGIDFYDQLYQKLHNQYLSKNKKSTNVIQNGTSSSQRSQQKIDFIAKVMAQKLLICLGDLWRYKVKDSQGQDYTEAEKYYRNAQALVPSNGVPYNQLAIIAILNVSHNVIQYVHIELNLICFINIYLFSVRNLMPFISICVALCLPMPYIRPRNRF